MHSVGNVIRSSVNIAKFSQAKRSYGSWPSTWYSYDNLNLNILQFPDQTVYAGTESLPKFVESIKASSIRRPLIVTDKGLASVGVPDQVASMFKKYDLHPVVSSDSEPNPSCQDVINIAKAFKRDHCDAFIGVGGGGPLDAMKISAALIAQSTQQSDFDLDVDGTEWITTNLPSILRNAMPSFISSIPHLSAIPTTAGTGSEGGKSAVIVTPDGQKKVYGHPAFMPSYVALAPQLTEKLPASLTAGTGVDALSHLVEAWFVPPETVLFPNEGGHEGGYLSREDVARCDKFALEGSELVVKHLPNAFKNGNDQRARLNMQIAALFGAKAFRKGDLGGIHACAHTIGALFHLHHGTAIARMFVPVLSYNEKKIDNKELSHKFEALHKIFVDNGYAGASLSSSVASFLEPYSIPSGIRDLPGAADNIGKLASVAAMDPCQTNPVPLSENDYRLIFESCM